MEPNTNQDLNNQTPISPVPGGTNPPAPEPTMEPTPTVDPASAPAPTPEPAPVAPQPTPAPEPEPQVAPVSKSPKSKSRIILIVILAVVIAASAGIGIWAAISAGQKPSSPQPSQLTNPTADEPSDEPSDESIATNEEVEITDTYVLRDLDGKLAALHFVSETGPTMYTSHGVHQEYALYQENPLSEAYKAMVTQNLLKNQFRVSTKEEVDSLVSRFSELSSYADNYSSYHDYIKVINADSFASGYRDIFGSELNLDVINSISSERSYCPKVLYEASTNLIFQLQGCGGTSPFESYYYKDRYTTDGENAYVYVYAMSIDYENQNIHCGVPASWGDTSLVCGTVTEGKEYTLNASNLENAGKYRFTFKKAADGTYYFEKVEKISN